jgi:hypothetical protein
MTIIFAFFPSTEGEKAFLGLYNPNTHDIIFLRERK